MITTIYGTNDIVEDVKQVYLDEFEEARIEFNNKQTRNDRKINNYFEKACTLQNDIACEIIIELYISQSYVTLYLKIYTLEYQKL